MNQTSRADHQQPIGTVELSNHSLQLVITTLKKDLQLNLSSPKKQQNKQTDYKRSALVKGKKKQDDRKGSVGGVQVTVNQTFESLRMIRERSNSFTARICSPDVNC